MRRNKSLDKAEKTYYDSILVTHAEYRATVANAKQHHQHRFKVQRGEIGCTFFECSCGARYATTSDHE